MIVRDTTPGWPAAAALTRREIVRLVRQPSRIVGTLGAAAMIWVFLAAGFAGSFTTPLAQGAAGTPGGGSATLAGGYGSYLLPGMVTMTVMFSAIFSALSLIEDRQAGFLQSALVSPTPRWTVVASKVMGGALIAGGQGWLLTLAAPMVGLRPGVEGLAFAALACLLTAGGITALGLALAWWVNSSAGFHGVMNIVLLPMWLLSGAFFPAEGASPWLSWIMLVNPMRWSGEAIRASLEGRPLADVGVWLASFGFAFAATGLAWAVMARAPGRGVRSA